MDDVSLCVRQLVRAVMGMPPGSVRAANQRADAGHQGTPYATVNIISSDWDASSAGTDVESDGAGGWLEVAQVQERFVASVQFFKSTPTPAVLRGAPIGSVLATYTGVTNGGFDIPIDGATRQVSGLNFSGVTSMPGLAAVVQTALNGALAGAACAWNGSKLVVSSPTTGQVSAVGAAAAPTHAGSPVDVSALLGLTAGAGAIPSDNSAGIAKYSNEAFDRARRLPLLLELSQNELLMQQMGLSCEDSSQARNLAGVADATWESRGSVDLTFVIISREAVAVAATSSVALGLQVLEPNGTIQTRSITEVSP